MNKSKQPGIGKRPSQPSVFSLLKPYSGMVTFLVLFALMSNGVNLLLPKIISRAIDDFTGGHFVFKTVVLEFLIASLVIFVFTYLQSIVQTFASEKVARDLRTRLSDKISRQSYTYILKTNPSKLLTNLTSDIEDVCVDGGSNDFFVHFYDCRNLRAAHHDQL